MGKRKYESLKKNIDFLKAERRDMYRKLERLTGEADRLEGLFRQIISVNNLRWPNIADIVTAIEPQPTPFLSHAAATARQALGLGVMDPHIGTVAGETGAYQSGYVDGWHARENTQGGDWSDGIRVPELTPEETAKLRTTAREGGWLGAKVSPATRLPDGSGFFTASFPLPKDHWIYEKDAEGFQPEMPEHLKWAKKHDTESIRHSLSAALKVAIRGATCGGKDEDFDPDALLLNFFNVLFRHAEETTCHPTDTATGPSPASELDAERTEPSSG